MSRYRTRWPEVARDDRPRIALPTERTPFLSGAVTYLAGYVGSIPEDRGSWPLGPTDIAHGARSHLAADHRDPAARRALPQHRHRPGGRHLGVRGAGPHPGPDLLGGAPDHRPHR